jgi:hypothetical protein
MFVEAIAKTRKPMHALMMFLLVLLISTILLRLLWNRGLVPFITVLRPLKNLQEALMLSISLAVIRGC